LNALKFARILLLTQLYAGTSQRNFVLAKKLAVKIKVERQSAGKTRMNLKS